MDELTSYEKKIMIKVLVNLLVNYVVMDKDYVMFVCERCVVVLYMYVCLCVCVCGCEREGCVNI